MARTINGRLTGRAAQTELRDMREHLEALRIQHLRQQLIDEEDRLLDIAVETKGFYEFWETVPAFGSRKERIKMIEEFMKLKGK